MLSNERNGEKDGIAHRGTNGTSYGSNQNDLRVLHKKELFDVDGEKKKKNDTAQEDNFTSCRPGEDAALSKVQNADKSKSSVSRNDAILMVMCCLVELLTQVFLSLLGPFFAQKVSFCNADPGILYEVKQTGLINIQYIYGTWGPFHNNA